MRTRLAPISTRLAEILTYLHSFFFCYFLKFIRERKNENLLVHSPNVENSHGLRRQSESPTWMARTQLIEPSLLFCGKLES